MDNFEEIIMIGIIIFAIAIGAIALHSIFGTVVDNMTSIKIINESNATKTVLLDTEEVTNRYDYIIFGLFIGLILASIIGAWVSGNHPILMIVYFIIIILAIVVSSILSYSWDTFMEKSPVIASSLVKFPITQHLISNLAYYVSGIGFFSLIVMFSRKYMEG